MSNEKIVELLQAGINQRDNMQLLYEQNIGFIRSIVKRYSYVCHVKNPYSETSVIEFDELLQEAFIGLCNAVKGYDASKGCKFLTYATWWIQQAISRFLENSGGVVRVPVHLQQKIYKYNQVTRHYISEYSREPSLQEYADWLCILVKEVVKLQQFMFRKEVLSLDAPLTADGEDSDLSIADSVADESANVEEQVIDEIVSEEVSEIWTEVKRVLKNPIMVDIILYRYKDDLTLDAIANKLGVSAETVRHNEHKALRRLRSDSKTKRLFRMIA
jgi:RNA polymerase primary sigma factor